MYWVLTTRRHVHALYLWQYEIILVELMKQILICLLLILVTNPVLAVMLPEGKTMLITGTNRGIGYGLTQIYAERGWNVIATARKLLDHPALKNLRELAGKHKNIVIERIDITDTASIKAVANKYKDQSIDILINNAAELNSGKEFTLKLRDMDTDMTRVMFDTNVIGAMRVTQAFIDHVIASEEKKIINISATLGSFAAGPTIANMYNYRPNKAALNYFTYLTAMEFWKDGVVAVAIHPGVVRKRSPEQANTNGPSAPPPSQDKKGNADAWSGASPQAEPRQVWTEMPKLPPGIEPVFIRPEAVYIPEGAMRIVKTIDGLTPEVSGKLINAEDQQVVLY